MHNNICLNSYNIKPVSPGLLVPKLVCQAPGLTYKLYIQCPLSRFSHSTYSHTPFSPPTPPLLPSLSHQFLSLPHLPFLSLPPPTPPPPPTKKLGIRSSFMHVLIVAWPNIWGRGLRIFIPIKNEAKYECACEILVYGLPKILGREGGFFWLGERGGT